MIADDVFGDQPVLTGEVVRLEPLTEAVLEDYLVTLDDPEVRRLTGSHAASGREQAAPWPATRREHHDRADWPPSGDGAFLGEALLEGRLRDALYWDGDWHDEPLMSVLTTDPRPPKQT